MNVLTINASDSWVGGAARVARELHAYAVFKDDRSRMYVGKKSSDDTTVVKIKLPFYRKIISYLMANDIDYFNTDYLLKGHILDGVDVVHCHNINGWYFNLDTLIKLSELKPVVWTLHDMWALTPHCGHTDSDKIKNGLFECSDKTLYPTTLWNNDLYLSRRKSCLYNKGKFIVVAPSQWLKYKIKETSLMSKKVTVIPNGVDVNSFTPSSSKNLDIKLKVESGEVVIFVASDPLNNSYKGFQDFEWLANNWPDKNTQFWAIGADVDGWHGKVRLVRATKSKAEMSSYMAYAKVLVLCSTHEVFPLVVLESISCGTPVVAYDVGGVREAIDGLPGCKIVPSKDKLKLMESLRDCFSEIKLRNIEISENLREIAVNKYSIDSMIKSYGDVYVSAIESWKCRRA